MKFRDDIDDQLMLMMELVLNEFPSINNGSWGHVLDWTHPCMPEDRQSLFKYLKAQAR